MREASLLVLGFACLSACGRDDAKTNPAASASASASSSAEREPRNAADAYCMVIEREWQNLDTRCTTEDRALPDWAEAQRAVAAAAQRCRELLEPSLASGRIRFEKKPNEIHDFGCYPVFKYEWAALPALTRLRSNCASTRVVGLVATGAACDHGFECSSGLCATTPSGSVCVEPAAKAAQCDRVHRGPFDMEDPCAKGLVCDTPRVARSLDGYPASQTYDRAASWATPGKVTVRADGPRDPIVDEWIGISTVKFRRCFAAELVSNPRAMGEVELEITASDDSATTAVTKSTVPEAMKACVVGFALEQRIKNGKTSVKVRFDQPVAARPEKPRAPTGVCKETGSAGEPCETYRDCGTLICSEWRCGSLDTPEVTQCSRDEDCDFQYCDLGICRPKHGVGDRCTASRECQAGVCIGGVCRSMCRSKAGPRFDPD